MEERPGKHESLWMATSVSDRRPALDRDVRIDVAVLGAGITGLSAALLLRRAGLQVAVLDQSAIASGASGHTTAKLSSLHGLTYARLRSSLGVETARAYAEANEFGIRRIAGWAEELGIDCDLRRRPNYTYARPGDDLDEVQEEVDAARQAGLAAEYSEEVPLPFECPAAVRLPNQAEFHPRKFLIGIAEALEAEGGSIFERSRALRLEDGSPCRVETSGGTMTAESVIVATHFPFGDRGLFFARMHPERSYSIAAAITEQPPPGMFISASSPTRSIRSHPGPDGELLLVGGEGHKVGQGGPTGPRYGRLDAFAREHWTVTETAYRWSTQDAIPVDGVPFVGKITPRSQASYTATAFRKWGLAMGVASAQILCDAILGRDNDWTSYFDSNRFHPLASAKDLVTENANVGFHFFADRLTRRSFASPSDIAPGEGRVLSRRGRQVAVSRDEDGILHAVSARCTHLACIVAWNDAERTWDCPCHGSRFARDGEVLEGPAVHPLAPRDIGG